MIKMFEDNKWVNLKIELMLTYRSPPRPPDINVVCMIPSSISSAVGYGTIYVDACVALWRYLASIYVPNEEDIWLYSFQQNLEFAINRRWLELWINNHVLTLTKSGVRFSSSACSKNRLIMVYCMCTLTRFGFFVKTEACCFEALLIFIGISSKWLDIHVSFGSQSYVSREEELTMIIVDWILQRHHILLRHLSPAQVYEIVKSLYKEDAKPVVVTNDDFTLLLHGDGSFAGKEHVDDSGRLSTLIFGSLTRPPETHCVFSFKPWIFMSIDTSIIEKVMEDTH